MEALIKLIIVLLIIVVPAIGNMITKSREARNRLPRPGGPQPPNPRPAEKSMQNEIDEFLRRVADPRAGRPTPANTVAKVARKPTAPLPKPKPITAEVVDSGPPRGSGVTDHVRKFLDSTDFQRRSGELGGEVAQADEKFEQRLQGTFEHRLGQLGAVTPQPSPEMLSAASTGVTGTGIPSAIASLFTTPDSIRQAVVINEILQRPLHRW
jgi:hypothetical protein